MHIQRTGAYMYGNVEFDWFISGSSFLDQKLYGDIGYSIRLQRFQFLSYHGDDYA